MYCSRVSDRLKEEHKIAPLYIVFQSLWQTLKDYESLWKLWKVMKGYESYERLWKLWKPMKVMKGYESYEILRLAFSSSVLINSQWQTKREA